MNACSSIALGQRRTVSLRQLRDEVHPVSKPTQWEGVLNWLWVLMWPGFMAAWVRGLRRRKSMHMLLKTVSIDFVSIPGALRCMRMHNDNTIRTPSRLCSSNCRPSLHTHLAVHISSPSSIAIKRFGAAHSFSERKQLGRHWTIATWSRSFLVLHRGRLINA